VTDWDCLCVILLHPGRLLVGQGCLMVSRVVKYIFLHLSLSLSLSMMRSSQSGRSISTVYSSRQGQTVHCPSPLHKTYVDHHHHTTTTTTFIINNHHYQPDACVPTICPFRLTFPTGLSAHNASNDDFDFLYLAGSGTSVTR